MDAEQFRQYGKYLFCFISTLYSYLIVGKQMVDFIADYLTNIRTNHYAWCMYK